MNTKVSQDQRDKCRIMTPQFRVSYPSLFKPTAMPGTNNAPKYSVTMLFKKDTDLTSIKAAIHQAKVNAFGPDKKNWPKVIASPVVNGDDPKFADKEGYKDCWAIKATSLAEQKPGLVDATGKIEIVDARDIVAGNHARAIIFARVWEFPKGSGKYGVQFILDHVQRMPGGEPLSSRMAATQAFDPVAGGDESEDDDDDSGFGGGPANDYQDEAAQDFS